MRGSGGAGRSDVFQFEGFRFDRRGGELFRLDQAGPGVPVTIGSRARALLGLLVERQGRLVSKGEIMDAVWAGIIVGEANLTVQISALRRMLGRGPEGGQPHPNGFWARLSVRRAVVTKEDDIAAPAQDPAARDPEPTQHRHAERRQVTAMSCELLGVQARADGIGLEELREAVGAFQRRVSETIGRHNGFIARHLGNTMLVLFGYPAAHEHDAEQAVRAGSNCVRRSAP